jgi:hypothetical protein
MDIAANDNRTPTEHRAAVDAWRETAPENDGNIFGRRATSETPRLAKAAVEFGPLMTWRRLREESESDGVGSSWFAALEVDAENDNQPPPLVEHELEEDSAQALLRRLGDYKTVVRYDSVLRPDGKSGFVVAERRERIAIIGEGTGRFERYPDTQFRAKPRSRKKLTAAGGIRRCGIAVFTGPEHRKSGTAMGTLGYLTRSGAFVPLDVDWDCVERESSAPPENVIYDIETITDARQRLEQAMPGLGETHERTLDFALRAKNFTELGAVLGLTGSYAPKAARRALADACAALQRELNVIELKMAA